jgi:predicted GNAT family acetyltransferase
MEILGAPSVEPDRTVRPARPDELELVMPASIAMFTEELGFSPLVEGPSYRRRAEGLIAGGDTFVRVGPIPGEGVGVQFKADLGAAIGHHVQIQGVWTHPALRGRGLAKGGMAAVVAGAQARGYTSVSLYVNHHNAPALAAYRAVGFTQVGTWATVMF